MLQLCATTATANYLMSHNIPADTVGWPLADNDLQTSGIATKSVYLTIFRLTLFYPSFSILLPLIDVPSSILMYFCLR